MQLAFSEPREEGSLLYMSLSLVSFRILRKAQKKKKKMQMYTYSKTKTLQALQTSPEAVCWLQTSKSVKILGIPDYS